MLRFNRSISKYLLFAFPAVLILIIWSSFQDQSEVMAMGSSTLYFIWEVFSLHLILWFIALIYFLFALIFSSAFREMLLARLARLRERDEREERITGLASKSAFLSTLAVLILLLFVSIVDVQITKLPKGQLIDGKSRTLSIGLGFNAFDFSGQEEIKKDGTIFSIHDVPLSKEGLIIAIILWQLASYHYFARKRMRTG